jgi:hypothetical protein
MKKKLLFLYLLGISINFSSCSYRSLLGFLKPPKSYENTVVPDTPDYSQTKAWHVIDYRDTIDKPVDVFFVHPTTYIKGTLWNQAIEDEKVNYRTKVLSLRYQASLFYEDYRVFVPKYRQATFYSFVDKKSNGEQALELAYQDVKTAFQYYLEHYNSGRPFIMASHSQGSFHLKRLLVEMQANKILKEQLVVAYLVGWAIPESYFVAENPMIAPCTTALQTGCIASWNTEGKGVKTSLVKSIGEGKRIYAINPLSWRTTEENITKEHNLGALQPNQETGKSELILNYCNAQLQGGAVFIETPSNVKDLQLPMGKGNYHLYDYSFFYQNVKQNAQKRTKAFFGEKGT